MPNQFKASFKFILSLIFLASFNLSSAQQVKKTTTPQKKTVPVAKKTTTITKKPVATKSKTVSKKAISTKTSPTKPLPVAELKMSSTETQMVDEINLVRADPAGYIKFVQEFIGRGKLAKRTVAAANELIDQLKHLQPLSTLRINMDMYRDAKNYGVEMMKNNDIEHSDLPYNENLSFGIENVRDVIIDLLIDDDIPDRGHRKNILKKNISMIAVHELPGTVDEYRYCYIQEFK